MTDRLEALERLQRLRESGAISDAEFEREKQALLGGAPAPSHPPTSYPPTAGYPPRRDSAAPVWLWVLLGIVGIALLVTLAWLLLGRDERRVEQETAANSMQAREEPAANAQAQARTGPSIRDRPQAEQLAAAFRAAFGTRATRRVGDHDIAYRPGALTWIGDRAALISAGTNGEECHACPGMLAVHYLEADGPGFRRTGEWLDAATDDYGRPPEWRLTSAFTGQPVIQIEAGGGNQGIFCSLTKLIGLPEGRPSALAVVPTGYSDEGAALEEGAGTEIEGKIGNIQRGRSFDVAYTGSEQFTETWALRGGRYQLTGGQTRMRTCG